MAEPITPERLARSGTEHAEQTALFCWAARQQWKWPELRWMHAIPNGGYRTRAQAAALLAEGVRPGVCDVFLPTQRRGFAGLYIEMKKRGAPPSAVRPLQAEFIQFALAQGYRAEVARGWDEAREIVEWYMGDEE